MAMNFRIVTIVVIAVSCLYAVTVVTLLYALPKEDLENFPESNGSKEVKNFLIVSQVMRVISCVFLLKVISPVAETNRENRNLIFPYIVWNVIATFICAVIIIHSILKSVTSVAAIVCITFLSLGTGMVACFVILMCLYYRHLLLPLRSRGPSTVAILTNGTKERTRSFLAEKEIL